MKFWSRPKLWLLAVIIAAAIGFFSIYGGYSRARDCGSSHDGQCGMSVMAGYITAIVLVPGTLLIAAIMIHWPRRR